MTNNNDKITLPQQVVSEENAHPTSENQAFEERLEVALRDDNMHSALERFAPSWRASRRDVFVSEEVDYGSDFSFEHMRAICPRDVTIEDLEEIFQAALNYW